KLIVRRFELRATEEKDPGARALGSCCLRTLLAIKSGGGDDDDDGGGDAGGDAARRRRWAAGANGDGDDGGGDDGTGQAERCPSPTAPGLVHRSPATPPWRSGSAPADRRMNLPAGDLRESVLARAQPGQRSTFRASPLLPKVQRSSCP